MMNRNARPRLFISSTVQDFEDLRSALKFWLGEIGFDVQVSNYPDFEHAPAADTIQACLDNVRASDFYVLLIGECRGWYLEDHAASITQLEYRAAIGALRQDRRPQVVSFVRQSLLTRLDVSRGQQERDDEELAFLQSFLNEVRGVEDRQPIANWTIPFRTFHDVVEGIKSTIPVARSPLARQAILENLRQELEYNLLPLLTKVDGQPFFGSWWLEQLREEIQLTDIGPESSYELTPKQVQDAWVYVTIGHPRPELFVDSALSDALLSGAFLDFDRELGSYRPSRLCDQLYDIRDQFATYARRQLDAAHTRRWLELGESSRQRPDRSVRVSGVELICVFGLHDTQRNIERLILSVLFFIYSGEHEEVVLRHSSPVENQREQMDRERVSRSELRAWLSQRHVVLRSALRDVGGDERKRMRRVNAAVVDILGEDRTTDFFAAKQPEITPEELLATERIFQEEGFIPPPATPDR